MTNEQRVMLLIAKHDSLMMSMRHRRLTNEELAKLEAIEKEVDELTNLMADLHFARVTA